MEADHQRPEPKRRKILKQPARRTASSSQRGKDATSTSSLTVNSSFRTVSSSQRGKDATSTSSLTVNSSFRTVSSSQRGKDATSTSSLTVPGAQISDTNFRIQQAKNFAVAQAQQDGCMGSFKTFDSQYGNFLVPVVPSRAELTG
ncbi:hypothetical protein COLO4_34733 [Corchorus olitorius]|uniref:Uncharacterized protein n=1 Tax=Corchorus olitorius TaxID=93759 RepID=A0A1R3GJR0_9ROSI|nr:hypothetical protein COLO4_34733 [Corchorus olitorius]